MAAGRDSGGKFVKGAQNNPGGLSKRQSSILKALDGLTPRAIEVLRDTMNGPDAKLALDAAKEIVKRIAPKSAPAGSTNVNVAVGLVGSSPQEALAVAALRRLRQDGRISEAEMAAVTGRLPAVALPAPEAVDVECEEVAAEEADDE